MTDNEYTSMGENPGIAPTTCTGCRAPLSLGADGALFCQNCGKPWAEADKPLLLSTPDSRHEAVDKAFADARNIVVPATNIHLAKVLLIRGINEKEFFFVREGLASVVSMLEYGEAPPRIAPDEAAQWLTALNSATVARLKETNGKLQGDAIIDDIMFVAAAIRAALAASGDDGGTP